MLSVKLIKIHTDGSSDEAKLHPCPFSGKRYFTGNKTFFEVFPFTLTTYYFSLLISGVLFQAPEFASRLLHALGDYSLP